MKEKIKLYYSLTKPRVLYGNVLTTAAGYLLVANGHINWWLFAALIVGTSLVIGAACVINNYLDQDIDAKMERTKTRALVQGKIPGSHAVVFGAILGLVGVVILYLWTNLLVVAVGISGFVVYVWLYGALSKRQSIHGTLVGSVSGAMPILAGYVAATNRIDVGAILVFVILFLWQMPEFYSISVYRQKEYATATVPVISVVKGIEYTKKWILVYTIMFVIATILLVVLGYTGLTYLIVMSVLGLVGIRRAVDGLYTGDNNAWGRYMFSWTMWVLLIFSILIAFETWLP